MNIILTGMGNGFVHVYTGNGKGKTTAALGLALRATCAGKRVLIIHFMKGRDVSELKASSFLPGLEIEQYGSGRFVGDAPSSEDEKLARAGLARMAAAVSGEEYDVVIADELNNAVAIGLIPVGDALSAIRGRGKGMELVITGRGAKPEILEAADLVTEMVERKHYFNHGAPARKGIEY